MKDYYYFLGVGPEATEEQIKKAYRKLSLKYHPDKNIGDDFFQERFREVQEAYDTLSNPESRAVYDASFEFKKRSLRSSLPPIIKSFTANKIRAKKGEEIILNWQTNHADVVKILPFGLEKAYGERVFKITDFKDGQFHVVLQANNTLLNKSVVQGITIQELGDGAETSAAQALHQAKTRPDAPPPKKPARPPFIVIISFIMAIVLLILYLLGQRN